MSDETALPSRQEVENQVATMLSSDLFITTPKLSLLLKRLIADSFKADPIEHHEYQLGIDLFNKPREWNPMQEGVVRQTLANLRRNLATYYQGPGSDDLVIIEFPKGFKPRFSYNPHAPVAAKCRDIITHFYRSLPADPAASVLAMSVLLDKRPSYALAHAHLAEMLVAESFCGQRYSAYRIPAAEKAIATCLALDDQLWLAHIMSGVLHCCRFRWTAAADAFQNALRIDPAETRMSFWYIAYLLATHRFDDAFECVEILRELKEFETGTWTICAAFVYLTRDFKGAKTTVTNYLSRPNPIIYDEHLPIEYPLECCNWLVEILMALIMLGVRDPTLAYHYAQNASSHGAPKAFQALEELAAKYAKLRPTALAIRNYTWNGFYSDDYARKMEYERLGPVGAAMALFSRDCFHDAAETLKIACDEGYPVTALLHILPLFYRIQTGRKFIEIVDRTAPRVTAT